MFSFERADYLRFRRQRACNGKTIRSHLKYWVTKFYMYIPATRLAQLGERRSAGREVVSSNPGRTNAQGL